MKDQKKILVGVAVDGKGGVDSYILSFCAVCKECGISVDVLTTKFSDNYNQKLQANNSRLFSISDLHHKGCIKDQISKLHSENHYDGAYWNISTAIMFPYVKASVDCGIQHIVVHSHAHYNSRPNMIQTKIFDYIHWYYQNKMSKLPIKYAGCSTQAAQWLAGPDHIVSGDWTFVPNPIDAKACSYNITVRNDLRKELKVENKVVVGVATAFMSYKNPLFLIDVFSEFLKINPNSKLLIAGTGPMEDRFLEKAKKRLPANSYELLGYRKDVPNLLQAFDIYVLPSRDEGLPLAILEAQAASLPCVMANTITKESIVIDNLVTQVPLGRAKKWAEAINLHVLKGRQRVPNDAKIVSDAGFNLESPKVILSSFGIAI